MLEAEKRGYGSYGLDMPLIHNAKAQLRLGPDYVKRMSTWFVNGEHGYRCAQLACL